MAETLKEFELEQKVSPTVEEPKTEEPKEEEPIQPAPEGEKEVVEEPKKDRPEKNYESELKRKDEKLRELQETVELMKSHTPQPTQQGDAWAQVQTIAENEMATTGRTVPLETLAKMFSTISQKNLQNTIGTRETSERTIRSFKRSVRKDPDFVTIEDDLDDLIDRLKPSQITPETLDVCLSSVRGKKLPELLKQAEERGRKSVEKDIDIVGPTEGGTATTTTESINLTAPQREEFDEYNRDNSAPYTEKEWKEQLVNKQSRFKSAGAKNIPQLMKDVMIR